MKRKMPKIERVPDGVVLPEENDPLVKELCDRASSLFTYCEMFEGDPDNLETWLDVLGKISQGEAIASLRAFYSFSDESDMSEVLRLARDDPLWIETNIRIVRLVLKGKPFEEILESEWELIVTEVASQLPLFEDVTI